MAILSRIEGILLRYDFYNPQSRTRYKIITPLNHGEYEAYFHADLSSSFINIIDEEMFSGIHEPTLRELLKQWRYTPTILLLREGRLYQRSTTTWSEIEPVELTKRRCIGSASIGKLGRSIN